MSVFDRLCNDTLRIHRVLSKKSEMNVPANIMQSTFKGVMGDIPSVWTASNSVCDCDRKTCGAADRVPLSVMSKDITRLIPSTKAS